MMVLSLLFWFNRYRQQKKAGKKVLSVYVEPKEWPEVSVQLPIYNESLVAGRLIDAIASFDYPPDCLNIQVLDDSTDETCQIVDQKVAYWRARGRKIDVQRREIRKEYKAGALKEGLATAKGEFIAIFDADFIPPSDWLKRAMQPYFEPGSERIGLVQTRWSHLNDEYSWLTRAQALSLDGHFGIEQNVRSQTGLLINFNGTAGVWRRACIEDAGNWRGDTLSEDLDLSFRAQLKGWTLRYLVDVTAPAELPILMIGYKRQQFRWSKGSIQVVRLLVPQILKSRLSPLMIVMLILTMPLTLWGVDVMKRLPVGWLGLIGLGLPFFYFTSQFALYNRKQIRRWLSHMPPLLMIGVGIAVNNTRAIIEGLTRRPSIFERTPKTGALQRNRSTAGVIKERFKVDSSTWFELLFSTYALATGILALKQGNFIGAFLFTLYAAGFAWVGLSTLVEAKILPIG
jgi:cellulose synthase/poly-beta-1,6-N-acetylglucosamine synthase-like glycosyltransferase